MARTTTSNSGSSSPPTRSRRGMGNQAALPARTGERQESRTQLRGDLGAVVCGLVGALLVLALCREGSAGWAGGFLVGVIRLWMGQLVYVAPILCFGGAVALACDYRRIINIQSSLGVLGLLVLLFGWVHLSTTEHPGVFDTTGARIAALFGRDANLALMARPDGGILGASIMSIMFPLGRFGSYATLAAIGIASTLLLTELTLRGVAERLHARSQAAAAQAKERALRLQQRTREAAERRAERNEERQQQRLAERRERGKQPLFLEVGEQKRGPRDEERRPTGRRSGLRRVTGPPELKELSELLPSDADVEAAASLFDDIPDPETLPRDEQIRVEGLDEETPPPTPRRSTPRERGAAPEQNAPTRATGSSARTPKFRPPRPATSPSGEYVLPPLDLLDMPVPRPKTRSLETETNIGILENTLGQFRIEAEVVQIADGPSITRYEIRLGEGIRVKKILDLADNIAMSLSAMSVRVEAPIPGKAAIGIEVPKKATHVVTLRECLESDEARDFPRTGFVLGKDVGGNVRCADLGRMPHLLVAGATNSGKSVCLNVLIASMLFRAKPDELKMIMIDPKRVELTLFDGIPHLIHPVIKDVKQAAGILRWVLKEMDRRYDMFAHMMTRNLEGYNQKVTDAGELEKRLPFIVVIIDELADLMMQQGPETEQAICRLAALARATGIHLVIATQRPSVDVITGLIKANIPSRIAFSVSSQVDSRTILDGKGAESLIGRGDMLFKPIDAQKPTRIQGAFLREAEVERLVTYLKTQGSPEYVAEALAVDHGAYGTASDEESEDELFEPAARFIVTTGHASTSMIQRKFKIGYTRAARLVDMMETKGIVGALDGAKPRDILMSRDSLDRMFRATRDSLFRGDVGTEEDSDEDEGYEEEPEEEAILPARPKPMIPDPFVDG